MLFRVYTGVDGQFHLEELHLSAEDVNLIPTEPGEDLVFRRQTMPGWHNVPRRQFVIMLMGLVEIGFGDGTSRRMDPETSCSWRTTPGRAIPLQSSMVHGYPYKSPWTSMPLSGREGRAPRPKTRNGASSQAGGHPSRGPRNAPT